MVSETLTENQHREITCTVFKMGWLTNTYSQHTELSISNLHIQRQIYLVYDALFHTAQQVGDQHCRKLNTCTQAEERAV